MAINQHTSLHSLISESKANIVAKKNGSWKDASVWSTGKIPNWLSTVYIPAGIVITVDSTVVTPVNRILVDGTLRFDPNKNTQLIVDTILVGHEGTFEAGTNAQPVVAGKTCKVVFKTAKAIDRVEDPFFVTRGISVMGNFLVHGQRRMPYLAVDSIEGDLVVLADGVTTDWKPGDQILIPGTIPTGRQQSHGGDDEIATIKYVNKNRIRFTAPLKKPHSLPKRAGLKFHIANITRNISFISWEKKDREQRGHVMLMKVPTEPIVGAAFIGLGRTDKSIIINDAEVDANDHLVPGTGTNVRGRYALHFHMIGVDTQAIVDNCYVEDIIGWGLVNHKSNIQFINNVAYRGKGAMFVTEEGDELGSFSHNMAVKCETAWLPLTQASQHDRMNVNDWGYEGVGFWFQGPLVENFDNVATANYRGFGFYGTGTMVKELTINQIPGANPADYDNKESVRLSSVPFHWKDLHSYYNQIGILISGNTPYGKQQSLIKNCLVWANRGAITSQYSQNCRVEDTVMLAGPKYIDGDLTSMHEDYQFEGGVNRDWPGDMTYLRCKIEGFRVGMAMPGAGYNVIEDCYFNNQFNIELGPLANARSVIIKNTKIGGYRTPYLVENALNEYGTTENAIKNTQAGQLITLTIFREDILRVDDVQAYFPHQMPNYVYNGKIGLLNGKTNKEIWDTYNEALGGFIAPDDLEDHPQLSGMKVSKTFRNPRLLTWAYPYYEHDPNFVKWVRITYWQPVDSLGSYVDPSSYKIDRNDATNIKKGQEYAYSYDLFGEKRTSFWNLP